MVPPPVGAYGLPPGAGAAFFPKIASLIFPKMLIVFLLVQSIQAGSTAEIFPGRADQIVQNSARAARTRLR